ncbi:D-alanine--D-alanine ligase family protein [Subtercola frigoramans]|uniref:D-alanine--D-alanine ligase n=1 Tax=Subtercola frigoramans TaxID=120298 RepID=A0ABS2KZX5_9MICO|nr:D-alanine--D-alanine ligase [Subtercola frigoramans]MBM7470381.1 D-alanine-D-alanine ligase [Subtercola frigoramans]
MTDSPAKRSVVVLAGGISHEREVSLRSGRRVADSLMARGHRVTMREPDSTLLSFLEDASPDLVWPALHGASGEDGSLRALLSAQGIAYVGSESASAQLAWHKPTAKVLVSRAGFATPESITLPRETFRELGASQVLDGVLKHLGTPVVVKPAMGGSAQGVTVVENDVDLPRAVVDAYTYGETALIEQKIVGTEISIGVLDTGAGAFALPAVEIVPRSGVYSYEARYNAGETEFFTPARLEDDWAEAAAHAALSIHQTLGLRHLSRIDLIIDDSGIPWFLEANVMPGLTETSLVPLAIVADGLSLGSVYEQLGELAIRDSRHSESD